jgi:hypothetical protein
VLHADSNVKRVTSNQSCSENIVAENVHKIGWKPVWTYERFLQNIDDQIQDVVDLGKAKSSLVDSLFAAVRG